MVSFISTVLTWLTDWMRWKIRPVEKNTVICQKMEKTPIYLKTCYCEILKNSISISDQDKILKTKRLDCSVYQ